MAQMMLVNPKRRRRRTKRRMTAKQARYFGPKRRRHRRRAVAAARPVRRHRRRSAVVAAPHRRRRRSSRRRVTRLRRNPIHMRGFNPKRFFSDTLIPAGIGAGGALGVDIALGYFGSYLPPSLQTGLPNAGVKIAAAVGIGMLAGMIGGKKVGEEAMAGAIVVTLYGIIKSQVQAMVPTLPLHGVGWVSPALQVGPMGSYVGSDRAYGMPGLGSYISGGDDNYYAGYYS
jgi:hypothetical protein